MFSWLKKRKSPKQELVSLADWERECPDCGVKGGELHDLFCLKERCPFCGGQLASCECIHKVLGLTEAESRVVEEYVDDSVEPLCGIMTRWKRSLAEKGRIAYNPRPIQATPDGLILAAAKGNLEFVRTILEAGVGVDDVNEVGYTATMAAARACRSDVVAFLLGRGANVRLRDKYGHTALHCAVGSPVACPSPEADAQARCVELLLKHGALVDSATPSGGTPLMNAAWFGCVPSVELLLEAGADPNMCDSKGRTAEDLAKERKHPAIVERLRLGR